MVRCLSCALSYKCVRNSTTEIYKCWNKQLCGECIVLYYPDMYSARYVKMKITKMILNNKKINVMASNGIMYEILVKDWLIYERRI